jgi:hypothetical protein
VATPDAVLALESITDYAGFAIKNTEYERSRRGEKDEGRRRDEKENLEAGNPAFRLEASAAEEGDLGDAKGRKKKKKKKRNSTDESDYPQVAARRAGRGEDPLDSPNNMTSNGTSADGSMNSWPNRRDRSEGRAGLASGDEDDEDPNKSNDRQDKSRIRSKSKDRAPARKKRTAAAQEEDGVADPDVEYEDEVAPSRTYHLETCPSGIDASFSLQARGQDKRGADSQDRGMWSVANCGAMVTSTMMTA